MKKILLAIPALLFCTQVQAACKQSDLNGTWISYQAALTEGHTGRCELTVAQGNLAGRCEMNDGFGFDVEGPVKVGKNCAATLEMNFTGGSAMFDLQLNKGKDAFVGQWKNTFDIVGTTSGVKR